VGRFEFKFNQTLLGPVPEEGISRLVTQQISEHRDHMVRYGLAFMIEHGFMQSAKGQMTYKANLEQIRDAVLQSLYIGVIDSLLRCKSNSQFFQQCYGKSLTALSARRRLEMECESFAEIQKSDHGWEMLNSRAQRSLKLNGVTPDAWVVDDGVKKYIASRRESWAYFLHGPSGEALRRENQGVGDPKSLDVASNCLIFETKQFNIPNVEDPVNITSRNRSIGEYMVSFPHLDYASCGKYTSSMRDIMVYDEDRDGFTKLSLGDGLEHCQRFDEGGDLISNGFNPCMEADGDDMFFTPQHPHGVSFFAQISTPNMPDAAVKDWITSVMSQFESNARSELMANLETLGNLVEKLDGTPSRSNKNTVKYFNYVQHSYAQGTENVTRYFHETSGMLKLDTLLDETVLDPRNGDVLENTSKVDPSLIPYGFGSYAGICELANHPVSRLALADDARKAKFAIDTIKQKLDSVCYGNMFTQQSAVPFYFKEKCTAAAVFCNLLHQRLPPVVTVATVDLKMGQEEDAKTTVLTRNELLEGFQTAMILKNKDGEIREDGDPSDVRAKKLSSKLADILVAVCENLSPSYRRKLLNLLLSVRTECSITEVEGLYGVFMQRMDGHDWFTVSKALDKTELVNHLAENLDKQKKHSADGGFPSGAGPAHEVSRKTIITQLTCSSKLDEFLGGGYPYGDNLRSYDRIAVAPQRQKRDLHGLAQGMANFSAGGMSAGDEMGVRRNEVSGVFGIKRSLGPPQVEEEERDNYRGWWENDEQITRRVADVSRLYSSPIERAFAIGFLGNAVHYKALERFIATGCSFPFNMIYARPYQTYKLSTGICMKAGSETGETLVGHADFQLTDNVVQKIHYGNFTVYTKSVVYKQNRVYHANSMFSTGYSGGTGCEFFSTKRDYEKYLESGNTDMRQKSIFAILAPYSTKLYQNPLDITGTHSGNLHPLNNGEGDHYASAGFYRKVWGWSETSEDPPGRCSFDADDDGDSNTVCFQGHQSLYNPSNGGMFDIIIKNTGHWGPNVYPGVGKVRNGHQKVVETVNYNNLYGGGGNLSGMLK